MTWIKILTSIFDDEKIKLIDSLPDRDAILVIWFKILCQAGKSGYGGALVLADRIPLTDEMLSTVFHRPLNTVRLALKTFQEFGMIEITEERVISIPKWEKYQQADYLEIKREQDRKRQQKRYHKLKMIESVKTSREDHANLTREDSADTHAHLTHPHAPDIDIETELKTKTTTRVCARARESHEKAEDVVVLYGSVEKSEESPFLRTSNPKKHTSLSNETGQNLLVQAGLLPQRAEELAGKHEKERIRAVVAYAQSRTPANLSAFIARALEENWKIPGGGEGGENGSGPESDSYRRDLKTWNALSYGQRVRFLRSGGWGSNSNFPSPDWLRETLSRIEAGRSGS